LCLGFSRGFGGAGASPILPVMENAFTEMLVFYGVNLDGIGAGERIVVDPDLVSPELGIDPVEPSIEADVGKIFVHDARDLTQERGEHLVHFHVSNDGEPGIVAILWWLAGLGVGGLVVVDADPGAEGAIEVLQAHGVLGAHLGFKPVLDGPEQTFDESARGRISRRPVAKPDMEPVAGGFETVGMVDFGVVEVELQGRSVLGQSAQQRVDENVEALAQVVAGLDDIPAVTVDESGKIGGKDFPAHKDIGAFLEVPDPEVMGVVPGPTFSHLLFDEAEFEAGCARIL